MKLYFDIVGKGKKTIQINKSLKNYRKKGFFFSQANEGLDVTREVLKVTENDICLCLNEVSGNAIWKMGGSSGIVDHTILDNIRPGGPHEEYYKTAWAEFEKRIIAEGVS
jgi:hypothetical protein